MASARMVEDFVVEIIASKTLAVNGGMFIG
jgi:hypothetical protein